MNTRSKSKNFLMLGGLGNQLFIFAAGIYYAHKNNEKVIFDFCIHGKGMTNHGSDIRSLNPDATFKNRRLRFFIWSVLSRVSNRAQLATYTSPGIGYDQNLENPIYEGQILGYFQTHKYLDRLEVRTAIDSLFLDSHSVWFRSNSSEMLEMPTISVHVRRGDYITMRDTIGLLSSEYYKSAIDLILKNSSSIYVRILVFSDEVDLAKKMFSNIGCHLPIQFAEPPENHPEEALLLMSQSEALIMSNSSFSWWAGQLGNTSKFVVCPSKWFREMVDPVELIPPEWHRLESQWEI